MDDFGLKLKDNKLKLTGPRKIILNLLACNQEKHLTADEIHLLLLQNNEKAGIATIYRTLSLLEKLEVVNAIYLEDGFIRYQLMNVKEKHEHHHLICEKCNEITDMQDDLLENLERQVHEKYGFNVKNHKVKLYGICKSCQRK